MTSKLSDNNHGNRFQSKLLFLCFIRAINKNYNFHLGTELAKFGGKFDDLIFLKDNTSSDGQLFNKSYLYLQAKHRLYEKARNITAVDLLGDNTGDFSLIKYFHTYRDDVMKATGGPKQKDSIDCVICTNIDIDKGDLKKNKIESVNLRSEEVNDFLREMLAFSPIQRQSSVNEGKKRKPKETNHVGFVATYLRNCAKDPTNPPGLPNKSFKPYLDELLANNTIFSNASETGMVTFHKDFIDAVDLSKEAEKLRNILNNLEKDGSWKKWEMSFENKKIPKCCRLKPIRWLDMYFVANVLRDCANNSEEKLDQQEDAFKCYQAALVDEKVIDLKTKTFHQDFLYGKDLTEGAEQLRSIIASRLLLDDSRIFTFSNIETFRNPIGAVAQKTLNDFETEREIEDFFNHKLILAVNTPNEDELTVILKKEIGERFKLRDTDLQSAYILNEMVDWFKRKNNTWLSAEEGDKLFTKKVEEKMDCLHATAVSIDYQKQLKLVLECNDKVVDEIATKLTKILRSSAQKMVRISTSSPNLTAVKVIAALGTERLQKYNKEDNYLVFPLTRLQNNDENLKIKKLLDVTKDSHHLLVIVCDKSELVGHDQFNNLENLIPDSGGKKGIIIDGSEGEIKDYFRFSDLSDKSKDQLLEEHVSFQGKGVRVRDLVPESKLEDVIDESSLAELISFMKKEDKVEIPSTLSADTLRFNRSLYIPRNLNFPLPLDEKFLDQTVDEINKRTEDKVSRDWLQNQLTIYSNGIIQWNDSTEAKIKREIWEAMKRVVKEIRNASSVESITEDQLILEDNRDIRQVVIISNVAGTGKSTILSHYCEEIKKLNPHYWVIRINLSDCTKEISAMNEFRVCEFFSNLTAVVNSDTPLFARSLLRYRFQKGEKIVIMLDGFDEIDKKCQDKIIQLMKAIRLTRSAGLYITTRSHLKEKLETEFYQFAYTLDNFNEEEQIDYLLKFWKNISRDKNHEILQSFAKKLVRKMSQTIEKEETNFVGIPLQCRIIGECFQSQLQTTVEKGLSVDCLLENIETSFNFAGLYRLLMKEKKRIFQLEKAKTDPHNPYAQSSMNQTLKNVKEYLRNLAIKTIVNRENDVKVLLGEHSSIKSKKELRKEEEKNAEDSVLFGLLDKNTQGKVQFIHRSYAEYLMADYLYKGFLPDDEKRNGLLDKDAICKLIVKKIFAKEQYEGVQVFFNSMLREILVDSVKWSNIETKEIPKFIKRVGRHIQQSKGSVLAVAIHYKNQNIFQFMCDCLDVTFHQDKSKIRLILSSIAFDDICHDPFYYDTLSRSLYEQSKVFDRFLSYYKNPQCETDEVRRILKEMLCNPIEYSDFAHLNQGEGKESVKLVLDILYENKDTLKQIFNSGLIGEFKLVLYSFISNENSDSILRTFLQLLSFLYSDDSALIRFLRNGFVNGKKCNTKKNWPKNRIKKTLEMLQEIGRRNVVDGLARLVLIIDPESFESIYIPIMPENEVDIESIVDIKLLLKQDKYGMTRLHRAALYGRTQAVEVILKKLPQNLSAEEIQNYIVISPLTPLYVALTRGHKEVCVILLKFLRKILTDNQLRKDMTEENGNIYRTLWEAIQFRKIETFELILRSVRKLFGLEYVFQLLKAHIPGKKSNCTLCTIFSQCHDPVLFRTMIDVIVGNDTDRPTINSEDYNALSKLIFHSKKTLFQQLEYIDGKIFQKVLSSHGSSSDAWMQVLLDRDICSGFHVLSLHLLNKLNKQQRKQFLKTITTMKVFSGNQSSYWIEYLDRNNRVDFDQFEDYGGERKVLKSIKDNLEEEDFKQLIFHNDKKVIMWALQYHGQNFVDVMLAYLSMEDRMEIVQWLVDSVPNLIEIICKLIVPDRSNERTTAFINRGVNALQYVMDHADKAFQLSKLVEVISSEYEVNKKKSSIWSDYLDDWERRHDKQEKVCNFLKSVSSKLGENEVRKLVFQDDGKLMIRILLCHEENLVHAMLDSLSLKENRTEMEKLLVKNAPQMIKDFQQDGNGQRPCFWINIVQFLENYANSTQLGELLEVITSLHEEEMWSSSLWRDYITNYDIYDDNREHMLASVDQLLKCLSLKQSEIKTTVKDLVVFEYRNRTVISQAASWGQYDLVQVLLKYLNSEDRDEIQRKHVDKITINFYDESSSSDDNDEGTH